MTPVKSGISHSRVLLLAPLCALSGLGAFADEAPRESGGDPALCGDPPGVEAAADICRASLAAPFLRDRLFLSAAARIPADPGMPAGDGGER